MKNEILPVYFKGIKENIYAGFWSRFVAMILDGIILLPLTVAIQFVNGLDRTFYFYTTIPYLAFVVWFYVYLVKKYGGTPGKLIIGLKIVMKNAENVNGLSAFKRYMVIFFLSLFSSILMVVSLLKIDDETFLSLGFLERSQYLSNLTPILYMIYICLVCLWSITDLIVLLADDRKRSVHDYIAGTIVVKSEYVDFIREFNQKEQNSEIQNLV